MTDPPPTGPTGPTGPTPGSRPTAPGRRRARRRPMRAFTAWKTTIVALVVFCLLGSGSLVQAARGQGDGPVRTVTLGVAEGIDRVSNFLSLNRPYDWANRALGRETTQPDVLMPPTTLPPIAGPGATTTTFPPPRQITAAKPLRIQVFGDSLGIDLGIAFSQKTSTDPLVTSDYDGKVSTGLSRQDFYNWPARMQEELTANDADVVVLQFGANDDKSLTEPNGDEVAAYPSAAWDAAYRKRIAGVMDLLNDGHRRVVWVGNPLVRRADLQTLLTRINGWVQAEAAIRPWVIYVPTEKLLAGPNGEYVDYLTPPGKPAIRCRAKDGIHPTLDCDAIEVDAVLKVLQPLFPQAVSGLLPATTTTTTTPPSTATTSPTAVVPSTAAPATTVPSTG